MTGPIDARALWRGFEAVHAVTYFADESRAAASDAGLQGFWMGYFGFRAAPMGAVGAGTVTATFANFAPARVERAVPDAWTFASPETLLDARAASAADALRRCCSQIETIADAVLADLRLVATAGDPAGRPLFAANLEVPEPADPVAALWHCCTTLREHRGDGHIAAYVAEGFSGLQSHLLQVGAGVVPADGLREARGWTAPEWDQASETLVAAGVLSPDGTLTAEGAAHKQRIEATTDRLAAEPWMVLGDRIGPVREGLAEAAASIRAAGLLPIPNPIGLD